MNKEKSTSENKNTNSLRDDIALGTAGFIGSLDSALPVPGRTIHPLVEGEMAFRLTFCILEKILPKHSKGKER